MTAIKCVNIRLIFPPEFEAVLVALSGEVARLCPSRLVLGAGTPPHVTLFSFEHGGRAPPLPKRTGLVSFAGLYGLGAGGSFVWAALRVIKTPALDALRAELLAACGTPLLRHNVFEPHVTLGHIPAGDLAAVMTALRGRSLLQAENIACRAEGGIFSAVTGPPA